MATVEPGQPESAAVPDTPPGDVITAKQAQDVTAAVRGVEAAAAGPLTIGKVEAAAADVVAVAGDAPLIVEETRRGFRTTEFYASIFAIAADLGLNIDDKTKAIISGLVAAYALARGLAKKGVPNVTPILQ